MIKYEHLCGKEFDLQEQNCYHLLRALFKDNWGIELSDIPCPVDFNERKMDLYAQLAHSEGFEVLHCHPRDYRAGDVFLMAINSPIGNHVGVLLEDGQMVHHLYSQLSGKTAYGGLFRNTTLGVYRHRDVTQDPADVERVDFRTLLSPTMRRKLEEIERSHTDNAETPSST